MKAISIRQPWAWAIFNGKPIENRTWSTAYRGPLLIHAGKKFDGPGWNWMLRDQKDLGIVMPDDRSLELGGFIGIVDLVDCVHQYDSRWFSGPRGLVFANPRRIEFVPYPGKLGIFEVPDGIVNITPKGPTCV